MNYVILPITVCQRLQKQVIYTYLFILRNVVALMPTGARGGWSVLISKENKKQHHTYEKKNLAHPLTTRCLSASIISMHLYFVFPPLTLCMLFVAFSVPLLCLLSIQRTLSHAELNNTVSRLVFTLCKDIYFYHNWSVSLSVVLSVFISLYFVCI